MINVEESLATIDLMTKVYYPRVLNFMSYDELKGVFSLMLAERARTFEDRGIPFENCLKVWCRFKTLELIKERVKDLKLQSRLEAVIQDTPIELPEQIGAKICFIARSVLQVHIVEQLLYFPELTQTKIAEKLFCTQQEVSYVKKKLRVQVGGGVYL